MSSDTAILTGVRDLWCQGCLHDLTIQVEDRSFRVHKLIMASVSDYFRAMLTGGMAECKQDTIRLGVITATTMESLISFIYKNHMALNGENVAEILDAAVYLQMHSAIEACMEFMLTNLDEKTCYTVLSLFQNYSLVDGIIVVRSYIETNIERIAAVCDAQTVPYDECYFIIDHWHYLEMNLFYFIMKWVEADYENRKKHTNVLMVNVRFCLITAEQLGVVRTTKVYKEGEGDWLSFVDAAVRYHKSPVNQKVLNDSMQNTVRSDPALTLFMASFNPPHCYVLREDRSWRKTRDFPISSSCYVADCSVQVNNFLIITTNQDYCNRVVIFDPRTRSWSDLTRISLWRQFYSVVYLSGNLYILGGFSSSGAIDNIERYSFQTNTWHSDLSLPDKRYHLAACAHNHCIYISGGSTETVVDLSDFDRLNLESGQWESKTPMLTGYAEHLMSVMKLHGEEVVCVVFKDLRVDYYSEHSNQWSRFTFSCNYTLPDDTLDGTVIKKDNTIYYLDDIDYSYVIWCNEGACFELNFPEEGSDVIVHKFHHCVDLAAVKDILNPCGAVLALPF